LSDLWLYVIAAAPLVAALLLIALYETSHPNYKGRRVLKSLIVGLGAVSVLVFVAIWSWPLAAEILGSVMLIRGTLKARDIYDARQRQKPS
jgi:ABC-type sugar transport system permease subunit